MTVQLQNIKEGRTTEAAGIMVCLMHLQMTYGLARMSDCRWLRLIDFMVVHNNNNNLQEEHYGVSKLIIIIYAFMHVYKHLHNNNIYIFIHIHKHLGNNNHLINLFNKYIFI